MSTSVINSRVQLSSLAGVGAWAVVVALIVWGLAIEDRLFSIGGNSIASLSETKKNVTYRTEDDVNWKSVRKGQKLFDGDKLSTSSDSIATIDFGQGEKGFLGPDTVVSISSFKQGQSKIFILNLTQGAIRPVVPPNSKNQLIVTSGANTYFVEPGQTRGFAKAVGGSVKEFSNRDTFPTLTKRASAPSKPAFIVPASVSVKIAALPSVVLAPPKMTEFMKPTVSSTTPSDAKPTAETPATEMPIATQTPSIPKPVSDVVSKMDVQPVMDVAESSAEIPTPEATSPPKLAGEAPNLTTLPEETSQFVEAPSHAAQTAAVQLKEAEIVAPKMIKPVAKPIVVPEKIVSKAPEIPKSTVATVAPTPIPTTVPSIQTAQTPPAQTVASAAPNSSTSVAPVVVPVAEKISLTPYLPTVSNESMREILFTSASFKNMKKESITLKLTPATKKIKNLRIGVQLEIGESKELFYSGPDNSVEISFTGALLSKGASSSIGAIPCRGLAIRSIASIKGSDSGDVERSTRTRPMKICSISDARSKLPLTVALNSFKDADQNKGFFVPKANPSAFPMVFLISRPNEFDLLLPFFNTGEPFALTAANSMAKEGIYGVINGELAVQFTGSKDPAFIKTVMNQLKLDFVFKGAVDSLYNASGMSPKAFGSWIAKKIESGKMIYLRSRKLLVPVSRDFMDQSPEVAEFVKSAAGAVFLQKVEVLDFRP